MKEFYYGSLSDSVSAGFGAWSKFGDFYIISQSFEPTDLESFYENTISGRLFYEGTKTNRLTDVTGEDPVQITFTSPTELTTQQPGESKLRVD